MHTAFLQCKKDHSHLLPVKFCNEICISSKKVERKEATDFSVCVMAKSLQGTEHNNKDATLSIKTVWNLLLLSLREKVTEPVVATKPNSRKKMELNKVGVFNNAYHGLKHYSFNSILLFLKKYNFYLSLYFLF